MLLATHTWAQYWDTVEYLIDKSAREQKQRPAQATRKGKTKTMKYADFARQGAASHASD